MPCSRRGYAGIKGIPITPDIHGRLPDEVKSAYDVLDEWWMRSDDEPRRRDMPLSAVVALKLIQKTPIPGNETHTLSESCYIKNILESLID